MTDGKIFFLGVDPGKSGGIALLESGATNPIIFGMPETEKDISDIFKEYGGSVKIAMIEKVNAMPRQGVVSMFTFGKIYGFLRGMLTAHEIPFDDVLPAEWQKALKCLSRGDKNITKQKAQQLFPGLKITHKTADALLIAEFCRRKFELNYENKE